MKRCGRCNEVKEATEFGKDATRSDGLDYRCRECRAGYAAGGEGWASRQKSNFITRYKKHHEIPPTDFQVELIYREELLKAYPTCNLCLGDFSDDPKSSRYATIDHVVPLTDPETTHHYGNVHLIHAWCNKSKHGDEIVDAAMVKFLRDAGLKRCSSFATYQGCGETKPLAEFNVDSKRDDVDGTELVSYKALCKPCQAAYNAKRYRRKKP